MGGVPCCKKKGTVDYDRKATTTTHAMFCIENRGNIEDYWNVSNERLGEGSFARVCRCTNRSTGIGRAVKIISKGSSQKQNSFIWYEMSMLRMVDHPNIVRMFESFENRRHIFMITDICEGGELQSRLIDRGNFSEEEVAHIMNQVFRAVYYMHSSQIVHRDLKPENIMFSRDEEVIESTVKLIDFGFARVFQKGQFMTTKCGMVYYVSPQMLAGQYDNSVDMWTLGVVTYTLIAGYPPFCGGSDAETLSKVRLGNYAFVEGDWRHVSHHCKDLVRGLLKVHPPDRLRAKDTMLSPFINEHCKKKPVALTLDLVDNLRKFRAMNLLKKSFVHLIASQLDDDATKTLRDIFMSLDWSGDGLISAMEVRGGLIRSGVTNPPEDLDELIQDLDSDGSGEIDYTEFLAASLDASVYTREEVCWAAFRIFDSNGDGVIDVSELKKMLNNGSLEEVVNTEMAEEMMNEGDEDGDRVICFEELMSMMKGTLQPWVEKSAKQKEKVLKKKHMRVDSKVEEAMEKVTRAKARMMQAQKGAGVSKCDAAVVYELLDDTDLTPVDFMRYVKVNLTIKNARIKGANTLSLWCVCELTGRNGDVKERTTTKEEAESAEPVWDHVRVFDCFSTDDTLQFMLMDHPMAPPVGKAVLTFPDVFPAGYSREMKLKSRGESVGFLRVNITLVDVQDLAAKMLQKLFRAKRMEKEERLKQEENENQASIRRAKVNAVKAKYQTPNEARNSFDSTKGAM